MKRVLTYIFILFWAGIMFAQNNSYIVLLNPNDTIPENTIAGEQGLHIVFPCNKTYFDKKQESWIRLNEDLDSLLTDSLFSIEAIHMYGAASPEGPYNIGKGMFDYCSNIVSMVSTFQGDDMKIRIIPDGLFNYLTKNVYFYQTFAIGDSNKFTYIPSDLFAHCGSGSIYKSLGGGVTAPS